MKFIHAADIHLDSPLRGLERYEGAPVDEIRQATRRALENLVTLAVETDVDFVLFAGDLYDGNWRDHNTGLFFAKQMSVLRQAGIKAFIIAGNHDAQNVMTKNLRLPDNVRQFKTSKPETVHLEEIGVAIHGQGFSTKAVTRNLSVDYPAAIPDVFNIGLLHTSVTGREGHDSYAPCALENLVALDYDYWALGHVHARECLSESPPIYFPGNVQGRHIRERGSKGCLVVSVDDSDDVDVMFHELDVVRWDEVVIDTSRFETLEDCLDEFRHQIQKMLEDSDSQMLALRVRLAGQSAIHDAVSARPEDFRGDIRAIANDYGEGHAWVEKVKIHTQPCESGIATHSTDDAMAELSSVIESLAKDEPGLMELLGELEPLRAKLPAEFWENKEDQRLMDHVSLTDVVKQAYPVLASRLHKTEGES